MTCPDMIAFWQALTGQDIIDAWLDAKGQLKHYDPRGRLFLSPEDSDLAIRLFGNPMTEEKQDAGGRE